MNRRTFLKSIGVVATGAAFLPGIVNQMRSDINGKKSILDQQKAINHA